MQPYKPTSVKHNMFRATAVIIMLCYILGPAHQQLRTILHTISHNFNAPSYVLQHDEVANAEFKNQVNLETELNSYSLNHGHGFLDFLDTIFKKQSNEDKSQRGETTKLDFKINKHITSKKYNLVFQNTYLVDTHNFWFKKVDPKKGYLDHLYRPPKV